MDHLRASETLFPVSERHRTHSRHRLDSSRAGLPDESGIRSECGRRTIRENEARDDVLRSAHITGVRVARFSRQDCISLRGRFRGVIILIDHISRLSCAEMCNSRGENRPTSSPQLTLSLFFASCAITLPSAANSIPTTRS